MDFTQLSNKELLEAIDFHRRQRNMSRGVNESAHMRQTQTVRLLEAEESRRLNEAVTVSDDPFKKRLDATKHDGSVNYIKYTHAHTGETGYIGGAKPHKTMIHDWSQSKHLKDVKAVTDPEEIKKARKFMGLKEEAKLEESEAAYKKADRDEKRKSGSGEYYVTNHDMKKTHSEPFKTSDEAISHANAQENKTGRIHTVHHIKNGKIQKQWQYSDSAGRFASYSDHAGQTTHIHEEVELDEADSVQNLAIQAIQSKLKKAKVSYRDPNAKTAREEDRIAKMLAAKAKMKKEEVELDEGHYHVSWSPNLSHTVMNAKSADHAVASAKAHLMKKIPKLADEKYSDTFEKKPRVTNITNESVMSFNGFRSKDSE